METVKKYLLPTLLGGLGFFGSAVVHSASGPFWQHIAPAIPQRLLLELSSFLALLVILLGSWVIFLHRDRSERIRAKFEVSKRTKISLMKGKHGTDAFYCTEHLFREPARIVPLCQSHSLANDGHWRCPLDGCTGLYYDQETADRSNEDRTDKHKSAYS